MGGLLVGKSVWMNVLRDLFPAGVMVAAGEPGTLRGTIYPQEQAYVRTAVARRRQEFRAGRLCAPALALLGADGGPVPIGYGGAPLWPAGVTGSISHCAGYCAAAVAYKARCRGIGLDIEEIASVGPGLWQYICTPEELQQIQACPEARRQTVAAVIFSAKESVYKCHQPVTGQWLDFSDVVVRVELRQGRWMARIVAAECPRSKRLLHGRCAIVDGHVFTTTVQRRSREATLYD